MPKHRKPGRSLAPDGVAPAARPNANVAEADDREHLVEVNALVECPEVRDGPGDALQDVAVGSSAAGAVGPVLTCLQVDGSGVLVVPAAWALAETTTHATLERARTFGQARSDPAAAALVAYRIEGYLREQRDEGEDDPTAEDDDLFEADEFFGWEAWRAWRPDPRSSTVAFLERYEPNLAAALLRPDTAWGHDYDPVPFIAPEDREQLENALRQRGYDLRAWPVLAELYLDTRVDPAAALRGAL